MSRIIPVLFFAMLFFDGRGREKGRKKNIYLFLSAVAIIMACFAAMNAEQDHMGASLSGMISIFMR